MELGGIHHVTAVTGDVSRNVVFYTEALGLRLVKKTVNQDDASSYHLFFADGEGTPGTDMTFLDWSSAGPRVEGAGEISATAFRVPGREALRWWEGRLDDLGLDRGEVEEREGRATLSFSDPEGQRLELVDDGGAGVGGAAGVVPGVPWEKAPVPAEKATRGLHGVTLSVESLAPTAVVMTEVMGFRKVGEHVDGDGHRVAVYEVGAGGPGAEVRLVERPDLPRRRLVGAGNAHHVAFRAADDEEHGAWRERLARVGLRVTPVIDRYYFRSLYFREPGGVLFEIATDGPGFAADEDPEHLGEKLALPPFLEPRREQIEANLRPIAPVGAVGSRR